MGTTEGTNGPNPIFPKAGSELPGGVRVGAAVLRMLARGLVCRNENLYDEQTL